MEARITECFNTCKEAWDFVEKLQAQNIYCENPRLIVPDALYGGEGEVFYTVEFVADPTKH
tara:strand:+ start:447 stop:629 length:183 start_codon:yes stop_codon:yes gene_type:complete